MESDHRPRPYKDPALTTELRSHLKLVPVLRVSTPLPLYSCSSLVIGHETELPVHGWVRAKYLRIRALKIGESSGSRTQNFCITSRHVTATPMTPSEIVFQEFAGAEARHFDGGDGWIRTTDQRLMKALH